MQWVQLQSSILINFGSDTFPTVIWLCMLPPKTAIYLKLYSSMFLSVMGTAVHCQKNLCTFCFILYKFCVFLSLCLFFCNNFAFECCHIEYHSLPFKLKTFVNFCKKFAIEHLLFNTNAKELHLLIFEKIQKFCNILQNICD